MRYLSLFFFLFAVMTVSLNSKAQSTTSMMESHIFDDLIMAEESNMNSDIEEMARVYCASLSMCRAFRSASLEFLFQYASDLHPLQFENILNSLANYQSIPFTDEQWVDYRLLLRMALFGGEEESFEYNELDAFKEKFCSYQDLLTWSEKEFLKCSSVLDFDTPVEDAQSLIGFNGRSSSDRSQIYMFCRTERKYPCYMIFKNKEGEFLKDTNGDVLGHTSLAYSRKKKIPTKKDGHTPSGLLLINGVMPEANKKMVFGKYRRMIVDFASESQLKQWLPEEHLNQSWWREAQVAKEVGRKYLRVHGTGQRNSRKKSTYYPFVKTRGCIAQRENRYRDLDSDFKDQKILLNILMRAQNLEESFENHTRIRSALYLVELSSDKSAVSREEILGLVSGLN